LYGDYHKLMELVGSRHNILKEVGGNP